MTKMKKFLLGGLVGLMMLAFGSAALAAVDSYISTKYPASNGYLTKGDKLTVDVGLLSMTQSYTVGFLDLYLNYDPTVLQVVSLEDLSPATNSSGQAVWIVSTLTNEVGNKRIKCQKDIGSPVANFQGITTGIAMTAPVYRVTFKVIASTVNVASLEIAAPNTFFNVLDKNGTKITGISGKINYQEYTGFVMNPNFGNQTQTLGIRITSEATFDSSCKVWLYNGKVAGTIGTPVGITVNSVNLIDSHTLSITASIDGTATVGTWDAYVYKGTPASVVAFQASAFLVKAYTPPPTVYPGILSVTPETYSFTGIAGTILPTQSISFSNRQTLNSTMTIDAKTNQPWLFFRVPVNGTKALTQEVNVTLTNGKSISAEVYVDATALGKGTYPGAITITSPSAEGTPKTIPVSLTLAPIVILTPKLAVNSTGMKFQAVEGAIQSAPKYITFEVSNIGDVGSNMSFQISTSDAWMQASPVSPEITTLPSGGKAYILVQANPIGKTAGIYNGTVTVTATGAVNSPISIPVTMEITPALHPILSLEAAELDFTADIAGANPAGQAVVVDNTGDATTTLAYLVQKSQSWISLGKVGGFVAGQAQDRFTVTVDKSTLDVGTHIGFVTVSDPNATNGVQTVEVNALITQTATGPTTSDDAVINVDPAALSFQAVEGTLIADGQNLTIKNVGPQTSKLKFAVDKDNTWVTISRVSGPSDNILSGETTSVYSVSVDATGMLAGVHPANITISSDNPKVQNVVIPVIVGILPKNQPQSISINTNKLVFKVDNGIVTPASNSFNLLNIGAAKVSYSLQLDSLNNVIKLDRDNGSLNVSESQTIGVSLQNTDSLTNGQTYNANIAVKVPGEADQSVSVEVIVSNVIVQNPVLSVDKNLISVSVDKLVGNLKSASFVVSNIGGGELNWAATEASTFMALNQTLGKLTAGQSAIVTVQFDATNLSFADYIGTIEVDSLGTTDKQYITVDLSVGAKLPKPRVDNIAPEQGLPGTEVTITGANFGTNSDNLSELRFGGIAIPAKYIISWKDIEIKFTIPPGTAPKDYDVKIFSLKPVGNQQVQQLSDDVVIFKVLALSSTTKIYPNPFNANVEPAKIEVVVTTATNVSVYIYDITGLLVWKTSQFVPANASIIKWDGRDLFGRVSADGVYLVRVLDDDSKVLISKGKVIVVKR